MNEKAIAYVYGSAEYPRLQGRVTFHQIQDGVLITAEVHGLFCYCLFYYRKIQKTFREKV